MSQTSIPNDQALFQTHQQPTPPLQRPQGGLSPPDSPAGTPPTPGRKSKLMRILRRNSSRVSTVALGDEKKTLKEKPDAAAGEPPTPVGTPKSSRKDNAIRRVNTLPSFPFKFLIPKLKSKKKKQKHLQTEQILNDAPTPAKQESVKFDDSRASRVKKKENAPTEPAVIQNGKTDETPMEYHKKPHSIERQKAKRRKSDRPKRDSFPNDEKAGPKKGGRPVEQQLEPQFGGPAQFSADFGMKPYTVTIRVKPSDKPGDKPSLVADIQPVRWVDLDAPQPPAAYKPKYRFTRSGRRLCIIPPVPVYQTRYVTTNFRVKGHGIGTLASDMLKELELWGKENFVICAEILWSSPEKMSVNEVKFDLDLAKNVEKHMREAKIRLSKFLTGKPVEQLPEHSIENVYTRGESGNVLALHRCYTKELLNEFAHNEAAERHRSVWHFKPGEANWDDIVGKHPAHRLETTTFANLSLVCLQLREDSIGSQLISPTSVDSGIKTSTDNGDVGIITSIASKIKRKLSSTSSDVIKPPRRQQRRSPSVTDDSGVEDSITSSPSVPHKNGRTNLDYLDESLLSENKDDSLLSPLKAKRRLPSDVSSLGSRIVGAANLVSTNDKQQPILAPTNFNFKIVSDIPSKISPKIIRRVESVKKPIAPQRDTATETIYITTTFEINAGIAESSFYQDLVDELRRWSMEDFVVCCEILWSTPTRYRNPSLEHEMRETVRRKLIPVKFDLCQLLGKDNVPRSQCQESAKNHHGLYWTGALRYHTPGLLRYSHRETAQEHLPFWSFQPDRAPWDHIVGGYSVDHLKENSVVKLNFICLKFM